MRHVRTRNFTVYFFFNIDYCWFCLDIYLWLKIEFFIRKSDFKLSIFFNLLSVQHFFKSFNPSYKIWICNWLWIYECEFTKCFTLFHYLHHSLLKMFICCQKNDRYKKFVFHFIYQGVYYSWAECLFRLLLQIYLGVQSRQTRWYTAKTRLIR